MLNNGWFTIGTVAFLTETERKDGKGSYLVVYVRFGSEKEQVRKAKVWSQNYVATDEGFQVRDIGGAWAHIELGSELTAYGDISTWKDSEGNERVSFVLTETGGLKAVEVAKV